MEQFLRGKNIEMHFLRETFFKGKNIETHFLRELIFYIIYISSVLNYDLHI